MLLSSQGEEVSIEKLADRRILSTGDELSDPEALQEYEARRQELWRIIEANDDPPEVAEAREELEKIEQQIQSSKGLRGRPRRIGNDAQAAASAVGQSISRARKRLHQAGMPKLAQHLHDSIIQPAGVSPAYRPSTPVDWML